MTNGEDIVATVECRECTCSTFLQKIELIMNMIEPMRTIKAIGPCQCVGPLDDWGKLTGNSIINVEEMEGDGTVCAFTIFKGLVEGKPKGGIS